jgi:hypothetical protein
MPAPRSITQRYINNYGVPPIDTAEYQSPDADRVAELEIQDYMYRDAIPNMWNPQMSCPGDAKLAKRMQFQSKKAQASMLHRAAMDKNPAMKYFEEELEEHANREWWGNENYESGDLYLDHVRFG